jgi:hypothetical protein
MGYNQGWFEPRHPEKYRGDTKRIRYMSSWEQYTNQFLDNNPNVLEWSSEEIAIPYIKPTDGKIHHYFPDYWVKFRNKRGEIVEEIWEIKPAKQIAKPKSVGKSKKYQLLESITYEINRAKWKAAEHFCNKNGYKFRLMSENQLFKK